MTGEVTLRGRVLPIGGLKEKTMAALRSGIRTVILPKDNDKDLEEIDQTVRTALHFVPVESVDQVFAAALVPSRKESAVEHMTALPMERLPRPCGSRQSEGAIMTINFNKAEFVLSATTQNALSGTVGPR